MVLGAILPTLPTTARVKMLCLGGVDVLKDIGSTGMGVPLESIEVEASGAGGVSSMDFTIDDPQKVVAIADGMDIRYQDITADVPIFSGWVQGWKSEPAFGTGRQIKVTAVGADTMLDWLIVPSLAIATGTLFRDAIQAAAAAAIGIGQPLRAISTVSILNHQASTVAHPIDNFSDLTLSAAQLIFDVAITSAVTLRQALNTIMAAAQFTGFLVPATAQFTVDFYYGLRAMIDVLAVDPDLAFDFTALVVTDTTAGPRAAEDLGHEVDASSIIRGVYVVGGTVAATGMVVDGTGKTGPIATFRDTTLLTAAQRDAAGAAYLAGRVIGIRGDFRLGDWAPPAGVQVGSRVTLTDANVGLAGDYRITTVRRRFRATREDWTISYGRLPRSVTTLLRRLTRDTLS